MSMKINFRPRSGRWEKVQILAQSNPKGDKVLDVKLIIGTKKGNKIRSVVDLSRHDMEWIRDALNELLEMEGPDDGSDNSVPGTERA